MSRYRKVHVRLWGDEKFRSLSRPQPNGQTLWLHLLTGPHTGVIPGISHVGEAAMAEELGWPLKRFRERFQELFAQGMAKADWNARVVFLPNAVHYNPPDNQNVVKAWRSAFDEIPDCDLKREAFHHVRDYLKGLPEPFREPFTQPLPERLPNTGAVAVAVSGAGTTPTLSGTLDSGPTMRERARGILDFLNEKTGRSFRPNDTNLRLIEARLASGATVDNCRGVIARKVREWSPRPEMRQYLRPATLFNATKFEQYLGERENSHHA